MLAGSVPLRKKLLNAVACSLASGETWSPPEPPSWAVARSAWAFSSAVVISVIEELIAASFALTSALSALPCIAESLVALNSLKAVLIEATSAAGSVLAFGAHGAADGARHGGERGRAQEGGVGLSSW
jgi:hypothetical protein